MIFICLFLIVLSGYLLARLTCQQKVSVARIILFGLGVFGFLFFCSVFLFNKINIFVIIASYTLLICYLILVFYRNEIKVIAPINLATFDILVLILIIYAAAQQPYGYWDAWAMWNTKAKFLATGNLMKIFSEYLGLLHPDYPLFLPCLVASGWVLSSSTTYLVPLILAVLFTWSIYLLIKDFFINENAGYKSYFYASSILFLPGFLCWSVSQYADIPLAAYLLLGVSLLIRSDTKQISFFLSGFSFGVAAFLKNEGLLYVSIFTLSILYAVTRTKISLNKKYASFWVVGVIPGILFNGAIKSLAPPNDFVAHPRAIEVFSRIEPVSIGFIKEFMSWRNWTIFWPVSLVFLVLIIKKSEKNFWVYFFISFFICSFLSFFIIYLCTPHDVNWHISKSLDRLFVQILPLYLLTIFFIYKRILKIY